jgi:hypothetical protein
MFAQYYEWITTLRPKYQTNSYNLLAAGAIAPRNALRMSTNYSNMALSLALGK